MAQLVKNPPAMQETWVQSLGCKGKGYLLWYSGLENPVDYSLWGCKKSDTTEGISLNFCVGMKSYWTYRGDHYIMYANHYVVCLTLT